MGSNWFYLCFNYSELCSRNVLGCFKNTIIICLFEILKMLYPPKGVCESRTRRGPFEYLIFYRVPSSKGTWNPDFPRWNENAKMFDCVDGWMGWWVDGWMDGWWFFTPFEFSYLGVWKQARWADSKNMLQNPIRPLDNRLWAYKVSNLENLRAISSSETATSIFDWKGVSALQKHIDFHKKM